MAFHARLEGAVAAVDADLRDGCGPKALGAFANERGLRLLIA